MIDWISLLVNSLWIIGLALALSTLSYASWQASITRQKTWHKLKEPGYLISFSIAAVLFCAGLAGTSDTTWETILWAVLGLLFLIQLFVGILQRKNTPQT